MWEDVGQPVSLAGVGRPTAHSMSVGPVFTPVEFRGNGYATSLVAQVSQEILDSGKTMATLYTDLSNPTSNAIYQRIGYRRVGDSVNRWFDFPA